MFSDESATNSTLTLLSCDSLDTSTISIISFIFQDMQYIGAAICCFCVYWSAVSLPFRSKWMRILINSDKKQGAYGKVPIFQPKVNLVSLLANPKALYAVLQLKVFGGIPGVQKGLMSIPPNFVHTATSKDDILFCGNMLDKVSRSFAAVIRQLPKSLVIPITLFYLALRALDTVEDEMDMTKFEKALATMHELEASRALGHGGDVKGMDVLTFKRRALCRFYRLLLTPQELKADNEASPESFQNNRCFDALLTQVLYSSDIGQSDEHALLVQFNKCIRTLLSCPAPQRAIITDITKRMGAGMAEYISRNLGQIGTRDLSDYNRYCHIVAGLVGEGLSRLFAANAHDAGDLTNETRRILVEQVGLGSLSSDMGLFLQKTNIIRDYLEDLVDHRAFWPKEVWGRYVQGGDRVTTASKHVKGTLADFRREGCRADAVACLNHLITEALSLVPSCLHYLKHLEPGSDRVLRFCAIPQVMAIVTMAELYNNPRVFEGVVKIGKMTVACIVLNCGTLEGILSWFEKSIARISSCASDVNAPFYNAVVSAETKQALAKIEAVIAIQREESY